MKVTPERVTQLAPNQVFVFGSDQLGVHGAGAAWDAVKRFGAKLGQGEGPQGQCYAIPTKRTPASGDQLPLVEIYEAIVRFLAFASTHHEYEFLVTRIGCGYAGFTASQIALAFKHRPPNVVLPAEFLDALAKS